MKILILTLIFSFVIIYHGYCGVNIWTQGIGGVDDDVYCLMVDTTTSGRAYGAGYYMQRTMDGGLTWSTSHWAPYDSLCHSIVIDPLFFSIVWSGVHAGPFKSLDYGSTWDTTPTNLNAEAAAIYALFINPINRAKMYAATSIGAAPFFVSSDTGISWQPSYTGMTSNGGATFALVRHPQNINTFYGGIDGKPSVYITIDGCSTWQSKPTPFGAVESLAIDPINPNVLYAGLYGEHYGETGGQIWKTLDGGDNWSQLTGYPLVKPVTNILINPETTNFVYMATWGAGVWKSKDAGETWSPITTGLPQLHVWCLAYDSTIHKLYCGTGSNSGSDPPRGIWIYTDGDFPVGIENWQKYK